MLINHLEVTGCSNLEKGFVWYLKLLDGERTVLNLFNLLDVILGRTAASLVLHCRDRLLPRRKEGERWRHRAQRLDREIMEGNGGVFKN